MPRQTLIRLRTGAATPNPADFDTGEPAWDSTNKKLYVKAADGTMAEVSGYTFGTISVSGQSNVVADSSSDILTLAGGTGISITTDSTTDTITVTNTGASGIDPVIAGMIF
jgi:hypothetical protein